MNAVSRNANNDTFSWPIEKRLAFGFYILRRQGAQIERELKDKNNHVNID